MPRDANGYWLGIFPPLVGWFMTLSGILGFGLGLWAILGYQTSLFARWMPFVPTGLACLGIIVGLVVGVIVDTFVDIYRDYRNRANKR